MTRAPENRLLQPQTEVKIFALVEDKLLCLCSISPPSEEHHIVTGQLSPTASHIGITVSHQDSGIQLDFHKLPLDSWHTQLNQYLEKLAEAVKLAAEEGGEATMPEMVYAKPAVLCRLLPPKGFHPCPTDDPAAAYDRVKEGIKNHIATGDLHIFNQKYFDNRTKAFKAEFPDVAETYNMEISYSTSLPTFHFIYYKDTYRQAEPCYVMVWWENHNQLFVYPLPSEASKNPLSTSVEIHWLLPQASPVVSSAVSPDSSLLAAATATGTVSVWNFQTHFCENVCAVTQKPDQVTSLEFFDDGKVIVAGTKKGGVVGIATDTDCVMGVSAEDGRKVPPFSLKQRGYDNDCQIAGLRANSSLLPSVVSSLHTDASVILWSSTDRQALCKLCLPPLVTPQQCAYTSDGKRLLVIAGGERSCLIAVDLTSAALSPLLSNYLRKDQQFSLEDKIFTGNFMDILQKQLDDYIKYRRDHHEADSIRWAKRWEEIGLELKSNAL